MPEQPQWSERTLDMPPQDPWATPPTAQTPPAPPSAPGRATPLPSAPPSAPGRATPPAPAPNPFSAGRAQVNPHPRTRQFAAEHEPTGTGWPGAEAPEPRRSMRDLRRGGEWTSAAVLFAIVCWGIWAISSDGHLMTSVIILMLSLIVAGGLFALCRLVGRIVLEKQFHRVRRSARGAHLVATLFLVGVGVAFLRQTDWVMTAYRWVVQLFS
jgi:hypothetical protein